MTLLQELETRLSHGGVLEVLAAMEGKRLSLPTLRSYLRSEREAAVRQGWRDGASLQALALRHGMSTRQVRRICCPPRPRAA